MEIFIDTANIEEIKIAKNLGILDGVTTNPSLIAREKKRVYKKFKQIIKDICEECAIPADFSNLTGAGLPVSAEVLSLNFEEMVKEGLELSQIASNVVVKLPCTENGLKACHELTRNGIKTNMTLCFSPLQALLVAKAGATYVSPFVGRLDDQGENGLQLLANIRMIYSNYQFKTKILVASIRNPIHILESAKMGADVVTVPLPVISQLMKHSLTDAGIIKFLEDARNSSQDTEK